MRDLIQEIVISVRRNRLRTTLTGFAVAWGIFILIVLLGAGNGLIHTFEHNMGDNALNVVNVYPGVTTKAYQGYQEGRAIWLDNRDVELTQDEFSDNILTAGAVLSQSGITLSFHKEYVNLSFTGTSPNYAEVNAVKIKEGRYVNALDMQERRKAVRSGRAHV